MEGPALSNNHERGFTLVEMIIAMVVIAVGISGVLGVLTSTSVQSADPMVTKQLTAIAEGMMEEIQLKPFANGATAPTPGGCSRTAFDEISDYNGYNQPACDVSGAPGPAGYNVQVTVGPASGAILANGIPSSDAVRIEVLVTHGNAQYTLVGWRNNFGVNQP